jgi:hypothetical protein
MHTNVLLDKSVLTELFNVPVSSALSEQMIDESIISVYKAQLATLKSMLLEDIKTIDNVVEFAVNRSADNSMALIRGWDSDRNYNGIWTIVKKYSPDNGEQL